MKAYIISGWFTPEQEETRLKILKAVFNSNIDYYSPREHGLYIPGKTSPTEAFETNIKEIKKADFVVASTVGKDLGSIFECGCAYILKVPIIYFWESNDPLNLMLSESAAFVATSYNSLLEYLHKLAMLGPECLEIKQPYKGEVE